MARARMLFPPFVIPLGATALKVGTFHSSRSPWNAAPCRSARCPIFPVLSALKSKARPDWALGHNSAALNIAMRRLCIIVFVRLAMPRPPKAHNRRAFAAASQSPERDWAAAAVTPASDQKLVKSLLAAQSLQTDRLR
jgi:hypothetical protein